MSLWLEIPLSAVASVLLWVAGTVVFDAVHFVLHLLLRSRWRVLRLVAWPHSVHHRFLDRTLRTRFEYQRLNVWCHLVPEFGTQLVFSAVLWWLLPPGVVLGCVLLQAAVFGVLLHYRGLDVNHRAVAILDAYRPGFLCPPAYHALHHVYPDAYFAAYNKLVDWAVGGGAQLRGRRFAFHGGRTPFGRALREALEREGVADLRAVGGPAAPELGAADVLVLCDPAAPEVAFVEALIAATRARQLPPEVWVVHEGAPAGIARHYYRDLRVCYRAIVLADPARIAADEAGARRAARWAVFFLRRGLHSVPTSFAPGAWRAFRRFRRSEPARPPGTRRIRSRAELAAT